MTGTIIDLASERTQRRILAERAAEGAEAFISGLDRAGRAFADLAWLLVTPIRGRDKELTNGIYQLALERLGRIVDDAIDEQTWASSTIAMTRAQARDVAFAAFAACMATLIEATTKQPENVSRHDSISLIGIDARR